MNKIVAGRHSGCLAVQPEAVEVKDWSEDCVGHGKDGTVCCVGRLLVVGEHGSMAIIIGPCAGQ